MSALTDLGTYLEARGVATQGQDLFLAQRPDSPDKILVVTPFGSGAVEYVQNNQLPNATSVQFQVVARSTSYLEAEELAFAAWYALAAVTNVDLGATRYRGIKPHGEPVLLGRDESERVMVGFNITAEKEVPLVS